MYSTKKVEDILKPEEMAKYVIGYPALEKHVEISPVANEQEKAKWFEEFVKFKEAQKVYAYSSGNDHHDGEGRRQAGIFYHDRLALPGRTGRLPGDRSMR